MGDIYRRCERCDEPLRRGSCSGPLDCMRWRQTFAALRAAFASLGDAVELNMWTPCERAGCPYGAVDELMRVVDDSAVCESAIELYEEHMHLFAHGSRRGGSER